MRAANLEDKWLELNSSGPANYSSIRFGPDCIPNLFVAYNEEARRCLILSLKETKIANFKGKEKEFISIEYFNESRHIIIKLKDTRFKDLFNDLIISIYDKIRSISKPKEAAEKFVSMFDKWSEFFASNTFQGLTAREVQGMYGELFLLKEMISENTDTTIDSTLRNWVGPYGSNHDFETDRFDIEVKTRTSSQADIEISSEYQLESEIGKELYLKVVLVEVDTKNSSTIGNLIHDILDLIIQKKGDQTIFLKALAQVGLFTENFRSYDVFKFEPKSTTTFNCTNYGFPKLTVSNISPSISKLTYKLRIGQLDAFVENQRNY